MYKNNIYLDLSKFLYEKQILKDELMRNHTTFRIGGKADFFIEAKNELDIINTYNYAKKNNIPFYIIGNGSNLLVKDNGIRGIILKNIYDNIEIIHKENEEWEINVSSGTSLTKLAKFALENSLEGLEFSYGIPGTVGGAVRMNAGAYGGEMKNVVVESVCLDRNGNKFVLSFEDHGFSYRNSNISKENYILLSTKIKLKKGKRKEIQELMEKNINSRIEKQPYNLPSAGSAFKRGDGFITSLIIDEAGLKGYKIGGAEVSTKHAGFIVNTGDATAQNVIELIEYIKKTVKEKFEKNLETEVIIIGE